MERLAGFTDALLARAQGSKVLHRLGHDVAVEAHDDAAGRRAADGDVEEDLRAFASISFASRASDGRGTAGRSRLSGRWHLALLVTLGSAAATAASAAERTNATRAMIEVQLLERRERAAKKNSLEFDSSVSQHASPFLRDGHKKGL